MISQLENLCLHKSVLMFKSFFRDDKNYTVCGLWPGNLHCIIPLLKVDSAWPLVIVNSGKFHHSRLFFEL